MKSESNKEDFGKEIKRRKCEEKEKKMQRNYL